MSVSQPPRPQELAVIGGGIAGLAAAHRLAERAHGCRLTVFEAAARPGGVISTVCQDGFQVEQSADNFITTIPWGLELCRRLGLSDQLTPTNPAYRRTFVVHAGRLHRLPDGFLMMAPTRLWPLAVTPILSPLGKLRAAMEYFIPPRRDDADESMAAFVRRRLGREAFERLVEPLVSAVYAADMEKLSLLATLVRFRDMERQHGSLIRAMRHSIKHRHTGESGARYSMFVTLRDGLSTMVDALVARLPEGSLRLRSRVERIERLDGRWRIHVEGSRPADVDGLIVATPSHVAARLFEPVDRELAGLLGRIEHSGTAIVSVGYRRDQVAHPLDGMGAVVPAAAGSPILAVSFSSQKYPHRAPEGKLLLRAFVGGARRPDLCEMPSDRLRPLVLEPLAKLLGIRGEPCFCDVAHWPRTMPQYHVGHLDLVRQIEARVAALPGLELAGNAYHGVGIPDCIHGGQQAADRLHGGGEIPPLPPGEGGVRGQTPVGSGQATKVPLSLRERAGVRGRRQDVLPHEGSGESRREERVEKPTAGPPLPPGEGGVREQRQDVLLHDQQTPPADWQSLYPFASHEIRLEGRRYHYLDEGAGPVLLAVHGNPTWSFYWRNLVLALRDRYRLIVPDHIGCGLSDKPDARSYSYRLAQRIDDLGQLIQRLDLRQVTLLAHDWGGAVGMGAAVAAPDRFARFVLFNTAFFPGGRCPLRIRVCRTPLVGPLAVKGLNLFARAAIRMAVSRRPLPPAVRAGLLAPYDRSSHREAIYRFVKDIPLVASHPSYATLERIEAGVAQFRDRPACLVWGMRDWCFTPKFLDRAMQLLPQAEVHRLADAGHYLIEDAHERIVPIVERFLAKTE